MESNHPTWCEPNDPSARLASDQLAFFLAATATGLGGAYQVMVFAIMQSTNPAVRGILDNPQWEHFLVGPTVVANLFAALLLLNTNRPQEAWRSTSLLLVAASMAGVGMWCYSHSHFFGNLNPPRINDDPPMVLSLRLIAFIQIVTLAELATAVATIPRYREFTQLRQAAIGTAIMGFLMWLLSAVTHLDWAVLPPRWRNIALPAWYASLTFSFLFRGISFVFAAILCGHACLRSSQQRSAHRGGLHDADRH